MKIVVVLMILYIGLHWFVKRSVDNYEHVAENDRHHHKHWGEG